MNHNVCGYTNDPDDPKYYDESDVAAYHTYGSSDYSYYDGQFAKELDYEDYEYFRPPEAQAPRPGYTEDCRPIGQFDAYDPSMFHTVLHCTDAVKCSSFSVVLDKNISGFRGALFRRIW